MNRPAGMSKATFVGLAPFINLNPNPPAAERFYDEGGKQWFTPANPFSNQGRQKRFAPQRGRYVGANQGSAAPDSGAQEATYG